MKNPIFIFCLWIVTFEAFGQVIGLNSSAYPLFVKSQNDTPNPTLIRADGNEPTLATLVLNSTIANSKPIFLFSRKNNILNIDSYIAQIRANTLANTLEIATLFSALSPIIVNLANNYVGINANSVPPTLANLEVRGIFKLGTLGTPLNGIAKTTFMFDLPIIPANQTTGFTLFVANAQVGSVISVSPEGILDPKIVIAYAFVTQTNIITVIITNISPTNVVDPPAMNFHVSVIN